MATVFIQPGGPIDMRRGMTCRLLPLGYIGDTGRNAMRAHSDEA